MNQIDYPVWPLVRLKYLFTDRTAGAWGQEPKNGQGIVCIRAADFKTLELAHSKSDLTRRSYAESEIELRRLRKGDLILEKSGGGENQPVGRVVSFDLEEPALCSNFLERLRPNERQLHSRFGAYLFFTLWATRANIPFIKQTTGLQNLDTEEYLAQPVRVPPLAIQRTIAEYLDRETSQIDAMIAAKERLLSLLTEKRRALIARAVTHGLNPNVPMRDSGVEWLGEVPVHWKIDFARWLFREVEGLSTSGDEELLTVSHLTGVTSRSEKDVNMFMAESLEGYKVCHAGDLVINTLWAWMGAMGVAFQHGIVSPAYNVYRSLGYHDPHYLDYLVRVPLFAQEVIRYSKGVWSSRLRLYPEGFFEVQLPVPPLEVQHAIVDYLVQETAKLDNLAAAAQRTIALLRERRIALIAAAVTGQIKVSE